MLCLLPPLSAGTPSVWNLCRFHVRCLVSEFKCESFCGWKMFPWSHLSPLALRILWFLLCIAPWALRGRDWWKHHFYRWVIQRLSLCTLSSRGSLLIPLHLNKNLLWSGYNNMPSAVTLPLHSFSRTVVGFPLSHNLSTLRFLSLLPVSGVGSNLTQTVLNPVRKWLAIPGIFAPLLIAPAHHAGKSPL